MRKKTVIFALLFFMEVMIFAVSGIFVIQRAYGSEMRTVQNLAGQVIVRYPETESAFMSALGNMDTKSAEAGADILSHYGYDEERKMQENPSYMQSVIFLFGVLAFFYLISVLCVYLYFDRVQQERNRQEEQLLAILENCLSGDYSFTKEEAVLGRLQNPLFADALKKIGTSLKVKSERLEEEHDNTKTLVTDISHQLKTPISALKVCFSMCVETEDEEEKEEFGNRCKVQIAKLETLAAALTNISRLETHMIELCPRKESVIDILTDSVNAVYMKALEKQIAIETMMEESDEMWVNADRKWTAEAISNIMDNAVKYSPAGSGIQIRIQTLYSFIRIEIEDNGIGIPTEEHNQIFKRFYRGSSDVVKKTEGAGVGLYLSRKILEDEGGAVFVRSAKAQGSIFVIQIPVCV
ncbi:MAG: HAMP domain-containing histidine kinase [Bacillus sp. (in: Bacteria)]|nr:HAMP domain-containing histidine kinase [Bacillus sp. (in: firmicutes)]MCM1427620.1 HAMP domain-containing histidine kinase [Eubacterium sp.]